MLEIKKQEVILIGSEKNFGIVMSIFLFLLGAYNLFFYNNFIFLFFFFSLCMLLISFFLPNFLKLPNFLWFKLGLFLGKLVTPIMMLIIFYLSIVPISIIMKILKKDLIGIKINKNTKSYWIKRDKNLSSIKDQF